MTAPTVPAVLEEGMRRLLAKAGRKQTDATAERDRLIREAIAAGGSLREVADAVGMSHMAVRYIVKKNPP